MFAKHVLVFGLPFHFLNGDLKSKMFNFDLSVFSVMVQGFVLRNLCLIHGHNKRLCFLIGVLYLLLVTLILWLCDPFWINYCVWYKVKIKDFFAYNTQ